MNSDFNDLLRTLNEHEVRYLVVGGYAVIAGRTEDLTDLRKLRLVGRHPRGK